MSYRGDRLPPDTRAVMPGYKEPLTPVADGFGYMGTIAYDESKQYVQCHVCGYFYQRLGLHIPNAHKMKVREYKAQYRLKMSNSLVAPKARPRLYQRWENMTPEQRQEHIDKLQKAAKKRRASPERVWSGWTKSLEKKNEEGRCPDQLIDKIQKLERLLGHTPSNKEFKRHYHGYLSSVEDTFGSWSNALQVAGLNPKPNRGSNGRLKIYDHRTIVKMLQDFDIMYGRQPTATDLGDGNLPALTTVIRYFGKWSAAKAAAFPNDPTYSPRTPQLV